MKKYLLCVFICLFSLVTYANTPKETLSELLKNMHSFKADFKQTILDKKGRAVQSSSGQMQLQRPGQFRWDVRTPSKQLIVTNGKRLWIYDPDLDQVTIRSLVKTAGETPAMLLTNENLAVSDEFTIKPADSSSSNLNWFLLTPKDKGAVVAALKLGFANQQIKEMQIQDHLGHLTRIEFNHAKMNLPLNQTAFNFRPPKNVDVIDETKSKH